MDTPTLRSRSMVQTPSPAECATPVRSPTTSMSSGPLPQTSSKPHRELHPVGWFAASKHRRLRSERSGSCYRPRRCHLGRCPRPGKGSVAACRREVESFPSRGCSGRARCRGSRSQLRCLPRSRRWLHSSPKPRRSSMRRCRWSPPTRFRSRSSDRRSPLSRRTSSTRRSPSCPDIEDAKFGNRLRRPGAIASRMKQGVTKASDVDVVRSASPNRGKSADDARRLGEPRSITRGMKDCRRRAVLTHGVDVVGTATPDRPQLGNAVVKLEMPRRNCHVADIDTEIPSRRSIGATVGGRDACRRATSNQQEQRHGAALERRESPRHFT